MIVINKVIVPKSIGDGVGTLNYNKEGKLVSYEHGSAVNVYLFHEQDGEEVRALELTMTGPMTYAKCINAAEMAVYGLQNAMDVASFNAGLARKQRSGQTADIHEHDGFMESVKLELEKLGIGEAPYDALGQAKRQKIAELEAYDASDAVNGFIIRTAGGDITEWLDPYKRNNAFRAIESAKKLGDSSISFAIGDVPVTLDVETAEVYLAKVERYAVNCANVTAGHKAAISALTTVSEVTEYDFTVGYPGKLTFSVEELS